MEARIRALEKRVLAAEDELAEVKGRARKAAQRLIEEIGASRPENVDETAERAAQRLAALSAEVERLRAEADDRTLRGMPACRYTISDACRHEHGDAGAVDEALRRLGIEARKRVRGWPRGMGTTFELILLVDPTEAKRSVAQERRDRAALAEGKKDGHGPP